MAGDPRAELLADLAVEQSDAPECRDGVGRERPLPRVLDRSRHGHAAWVRMLDDHRGRERELAQHAARAFEVDEVVVRELLAAELLDLRQQIAPRADLSVV